MNTPARPPKLPDGQGAEQLNMEARTPRPVQVASTSYGRAYLSLPRMITHWHQANAVLEQVAVGASVLEVGPGAGHTTWLMRNWGLQVTTLDFDPELKPDMVGDVTALPCADKSFDCVLAAEVLEHIPFTEFTGALVEMRRVARKAVVISLPAPFVGASMLLNVSGLQMGSIHAGVPFWIKHKFDGEHYWELGKRGTSLRTVRRAIQASGLNIVAAFRPAPSLYAYFFVLA